MITCEFCGRRTHSAREPSCHMQYINDLTAEVRRKERKMKEATKQPKKVKKTKKPGSLRVFLRALFTRK